MCEFGFWPNTLVSMTRGCFLMQRRVIFTKGAPRFMPFHAVHVENSQFIDFRVHEWRWAEGEHEREQVGAIHVTLVT